MDLEKLEKNVKARGFEFFHAATAEEAVQHVLEQVQNTSVGIGGSTTVDQIGLYDRLKENNEVHWHWKDGPKPEVYRDAAEAEVYLSGVNGIAETGELVNIDGKGNRVAALSYAVGKRIYLIAGKNKVCPDLAPQSSAQETLQRRRTCCAFRESAPAPMPSAASTAVRRTGAAASCRS